MKVSGDSCGTQQQFPNPILLGDQDPNIPSVTPQQLADALYDADHQLKQSDDFDAIPGTIGFENIAILDHLDRDKEDCERFARMAVDQFNYRYKDNMGELVFGKVLKATVKAVTGLRFYITSEAVNVGVGWQLMTFQAVVVRDIKGKEVVQSFRFLSDSKDDPWLWVGDLSWVLV